MDPSARLPLDLSARAGHPCPMDNEPRYNEKAIASDAGISAQSVREAAAELADGNYLRKIKLLGAPTILENRLLLPFPATEAALEDLVSQLPDLLNMRGTGNVRKGRLRWGADSYATARSGRDFALDVIVREKETEIRARARLRGAAAGIFGVLVGGLGLGAGMGFGFGVGMGALDSPAFALIFTFGSIAASFLLARSIYRSLARRTRKKLREIAGKAADALGRPAGSGNTIPY